MHCGGVFFWTCEVGVCRARGNEGEGRGARLCESDGGKPPTHTSLLGEEKENQYIRGWDAGYGHIKLGMICLNRQSISGRRGFGGGRTEQEAVQPQGGGSVGDERRLSLIYIFYIIFYRCIIILFRPAINHPFLFFIFY